MQYPLADDLFTWPSERPRLLGSRCQACGIIDFPVQTACPNCCERRLERIELKDRGLLWTWTTQEYPPKSPPFRPADADKPFQPFAVGYVELPGQVRVESRLVNCDLGKLRIGMEMELVIVPLGEDSRGNALMIFAFQPLANQA